MIDWALSDFLSLAWCGVMGIVPEITLPLPHRHMTILSRASCYFQTSAKCSKADKTCGKLLDWHVEGSIPVKRKRKLEHCRYPRSSGPRTSLRPSSPSPRYFLFSEGLARLTALEGV